MYLMPYDKELLNLDDKKAAEEVKEVKKETKGVSPSVARRIRFYLREHGISQRALAEKMGNISQGQLSHCLLGRYTLTRERVDEICKALEITYEELMGVSGESSEPMVNAGSEETVVDAEVVDISQVDVGQILHEELDETVSDAVSEIMGETPLASSDILKPVDAKVEEINVRAIFENMKDAMLKEVKEELDRMRFIQTATLAPAKEPHPHQRLVDELKKAAETIIKNAESMIGTEKSLGDVQVTIYLRPHEVPRINVDKDVYPEW